MKIIYENKEEIIIKNNEILKQLYILTKIKEYIKKIKIDYMIIYEYQDKIEIKKNSKFLTLLYNINEQLHNDKIKIVVNYIENKIEYLKKQEKKNIKIFIKYNNENFWIESSLSEIENIPLYSQDKIQILWENLNYYNENISNKELEKFIKFIFENEKKISFNEKILNHLILLLEKIYESEFQNLLLNKIINIKEESKIKVINVMLKKILLNIKKNFISKIFDNELSIYEYDEKYEIYINFNKSLNAEKTLEKIYSYLSHFLEINNLEISIKTLNKFHEKKKILIKDKLIFIATNEYKIENKNFNIENFKKSIISEIQENGFKKIKINKIFKNNTNEKIL